MTGRSIRRVKSMRVWDDADGSTQVELTTLDGTVEQFEFGRTDARALGHAIRIPAGSDHRHERRAAIERMAEDRDALARAVEILGK